ncbi:MAG: histidine kinase [Actinomycetota bacterium]|nr:histidine kinase [Actinomycetota bacterium]
MLLPIACILLQLVSVRTGVGVEPSAYLVAISTVAGIGSGIALLWRDRYPVAVLAVTLVCYLIQVSLAAPVLPASAAVATEVVARRTAESDKESPRVRGLATLAAGLAVVAAAVTMAGSAFLAAPFGLVLLAAAFLGQFRATRAAHAVAQRREVVLAERLRIARDLHDVVGHGMGAITVQAGAARLAVTAGDDREATRALASIESAGRGVLREVRWLVGLLREDSERPGLADIAQLVAAARRSGLNVDLETDGELTVASRDSGEAAYRIVQEALTNVLRHSGENTASVSVRVGENIQLRVHNGAARDAGGAAEGNGLRGLRERAAAVGGRVQLGPDPDGWTVRAELPLAGQVR